MRNSFKIVTLLILVCACTFSYSQNSDWQSITLKQNTSFKQMCSQIDSYFDTHKELKEIEEEDGEEGSEYSKYQQWKWFWEARLDENGFLPSADVIKKSFLEAKALTESQNALKTATTQCSWNYIDITSSVGGYWGMGRTTSVVFHPTNDNIYYLSCPGGGIWKTINGGLNYTCMDVGLPYGATSFLTIDRFNPNTLYVSNGDSGGWWNYSTGIYKSTDGGLTWNPTNLNFAAINTTVYELKINPLHSNELWCATSSGLYKTINAGLNWSLSVSGGNHRDIEFMPTSSTTIYRSFSNQVFKSINKGVSWALIYTVPGASDIYLSTTPLDSNRLLINADMPGSNYNIYESTDAGASFTAKTSIIGSETGKCLEYSRLNVNTIYGGSLNAWKSNNGGMSWVKMTQWAGSSGPLPEVHADIHHIGFSNNSQHVYFCNDGGLYKYNEVLNSWTNLSNGLLNHLIYRIANGTNSSVFMLTGTQDNGGRKRIGQNTWVNANGGDGMEVAIKPGDTNTYYTSYCGGSNLRRTTNGGSNITNIHQLIYNSVATYTARITAPVGKWVTPYDLVPNYPNIIVAGYDTIFRSLDQGNTWLPISGDLSGGWNITDLEISPTNTNVIYASEGVRFYRTLNSGATWSTSVLPGSGQITRIACHPTKSNVLWITKGTYAVNNTAQTKVFKSIDGGVTWQGYDTGLPNVPHNCIIYQNGSADKLFVANDIGVYYRDSTMSSWQPYGSGLPITLCNDLKIQYSGQKLRVGTFGRGIWEVDLCNASIATSINSELVSDESVFVYPNPSNGVFIITNKTIETMEYIKLFSIDGKLLPIEIIESSSIQKIIKTNCVAGIYIIESKVGSKISRFKVIIN